MTMRLRTLAAAFVLLPLAACGSTPTSPSTTTSPTTITWTTRIGPGGTASRTFTTSASGTATATLQAAGVPLGLGLGIPAANGTGCRLATSTTAAANQATALSAPVDGGSYCVAIFDPGVIASGEVAFVVDVVYP